MSFIGKAVKKVFKGIKKVVKKVVKGVGKIMNKIGPVGMIAMGILLPGIGTALSASASPFLQGVGKVVSFIGSPIKSITGTSLTGWIGKGASQLGFDKVASMLGTGAEGGLEVPDASPLMEARTIPGDPLTEVLASQPVQVEGASFAPSLDPAEQALDRISFEGSELSKSFSFEEYQDIARRSSLVSPTDELASITATADSKFKMPKMPSLGAPAGGGVMPTDVGGGVPTDPGAGAVQAGAGHLAGLPKLWQELNPWAQSLIMQAGELGQQQAARTRG